MVARGLLVWRIRFCGLAPHAAHDGRLGFDTSGFLPGQRQDLNRHGTPLGLEPGGEGTLGYILDRDLDNRDHSVEFTYMGFNNWRADDSLRSENPQSLRTGIAPTLRRLQLRRYL